MNIAIIGCGEVGYAYAVALHDLGCSLQLYTPRPSEKILKYVAKNNIILHPNIGQWLENIDFVMGCTPGAVALDVVNEVIIFMKENTLYADFSSSSPDSKRQAAKLASTKRIEFVDVVIMGSIDLNGVRTPLVCAGEGAEKVASLFELLDVPIKILTDAAAGDAASLKLLRAIFMKGLAALTVECVTAAEKQGVKKLLYETLSDFDKTPLSEFLDMLLRNHVTHACRQRQEIAEAKKQLISLKLPVQLLSAVETLFTTTCELIKTDPINKANPTTQEALNWLIKNHYKSV